MSDQLLNEDDLKAWSKIDQTAALVRWLEAEPHPIPFKRTPKGAICTTLDAVSDALAKREEAGQKTWAA